MIICKCGDRQDADIFLDGHKFASHAEMPCEICFHRFEVDDSDLDDYEETFKSDDIGEDELTIQEIAIRNYLVKEGRLEEIQQGSTTDTLEAES